MKYDNIKQQVCVVASSTADAKLLKSDCSSGACTPTSSPGQWATKLCYSYASVFGTAGCTGTVCLVARAGCLQQAKPATIQASCVPALPNPT